MRPKPPFSIKVPKLDLPPSIELSSPSAVPVHERIASLEALRQQHLRAAAEIEEEVARLRDLLIGDNGDEHAATHHDPLHPTTTYNTEAEPRDARVVDTDSTSQKAFMKPNSALLVHMEPVPLYSPLPKANIMFAGHTPLAPCSPALEQQSPSPERRSPTAETTPEQYLEGPLMLPLLPGDGSDDGISLRALGERLADIAKERAEDLLQAEVHVKAETINIKFDRNEVVDGILLKPPSMNMGAPFGQL